MPAGEAAPVRLLEQSSGPTSQQTPPGVVRSRLVAIRADQLPAPSPPTAGQRGGSTLILNLFDDVTVEAVFDRFDPNPRGTTWVGHVRGIAGSTVTLVYRDGLVTGSIVTPEAAYTLRPVGNAAPRGAGSGFLHRVSQVDQSAGRPEAPPIRVELPAAPASARMGVPAEQDTADFIDVLVLYTPAAAADVGGDAGMDGLIALAISESNTSYANSGITQQLRLAHTERIEHVETDLETDLQDAQAGHGAFGGVAALRDAYLADLVLLVESTAVKAYCGIAFQMTTLTPAFADYAFSAVEVDCISPGYSFQHELGHNMGANHDWYTEGPTTPSYAHGYVHTDAGGPSWITIMSYFDLCTARGVSCGRLLYWSNPDVTMNGVPMGVPAGTNTTCLAGDPYNTQCDADDHRRLNETALVVANFRSSPPPSAFSKMDPADANVQGGTSLTLTWAAASGADSYEYCLDTTFDATCDGSWMPMGPSLAATVSGLLPGTAYNWQVRAVNAFGFRPANDGAWWGFSTPGFSLARYDSALMAPRCGSVERICDSGTALVGAGTMDGGAEPHQPNTIGGSCTDSQGLSFHVDESIDRIRIVSADSLPIGVGRTVTIRVTAWISDPNVDRLDLYHAADANAPAWTLLGTLAADQAGSQVLSLDYALPAGSLQAIRGRLRSGGAPSPCAQTGFEDHDDLVFAVGPANNTSFADNGSFADGALHWLSFATPDPSYLTMDATGGLLQFYRSAPPAGTTNQAVVFQETGMPLGTRAPVQASFLLGNTDTVRKRISVLLHDSNFSDLSVCTFWLAPGAPLASYVMRTHTTRAWTNATISFYAASANAPGNISGFYLVDDVAIQVVPGQSTSRTECEDPTAPSTTWGSVGPEMLGNGDFSSGSLAPWNLFGQIAGNVQNGVFEFIKLAGPPAGVVFQITSQPVDQGEVLTATFELGNSSPVRKRVTAILHDSSFSDLSACTFWLDPGQPLTPFTYRTFVTEPWTSATLSIYPATTGPDTWIRLDNASLRRTPSAATVGTECAESE